MLRGENITCGTTSTGTGTLTLAACPSPPGGVDFYQWLTATGLGFVSGNAILTTYTIIEYTDTTFTTAKSYEKGVGALTLSSSLAASTLVRTTVQSTATSLNTTASPTYSAPTAISIGTAANTLIFVGASAADGDACDPYYDTVSTGTDNCIMAANIGSVSSASSAATSIANGQDMYIQFWWRVPKVITKCVVKTGSSGPATDAANSMNASIYQIGSNGRPGKKLIDFGAFAGTNIFNSTANEVTATSAGGFFLSAGEYFLCLLPFRTTPAGTASLRGYPVLQPGGITVGAAVIIGSNATGDTLTAGLMADPANTTSWSNVNGNNGFMPWFGFI